MNRRERRKKPEIVTIPNSNGRSISTSVYEKQMIDFYENYLILSPEEKKLKYKVEERNRKIKGVIEDEKD